MKRLLNANHGALDLVPESRCRT